jgi:hypothetical protein
MRIRISQGFPFTQVGQTAVWPSWRLWPFWCGFTDLVRSSFLGLLSDRFDDPASTMFVSGR